MLDKFEDLLGTILTNVEVTNQDEIIFTLDNGEQYKLYHHQDCCESVMIEDINGDLNTLVGSEILMAEEATNCAKPERFNNELIEEYQNEIETWTFYKLATLNGYVTIRWFGTSNGYYSESVDWTKIAR